MTAWAEGRPVWLLLRPWLLQRPLTRPVFALYQRSSLRAWRCQDACNVARVNCTRKAGTSRTRRHKE
jgi:hypothetical protein